jgi:two-component system, NtrC family, nitrogen regulation response regulator NtrX
MNKILIADDDQKIIDSLDSILQKEGYAVVKTTNPDEVLSLIEQEEPALAILDIFFGSQNPAGERLIKEISAKFPHTQCLVISGESDVYKVLSCLKSGALDFLEKPISLPRLLTSVKNSLKIIHSQQYSQQRCSILGKSKAILDVIFRIKKVAKLNESVLILGESGTGKELVAENLHLHSNRFEQPFLRVNCAALNPELIESELFGHKKGSFTGADKDKKGYFEIAHNGTLFLDEIGDFPMHLQTKLLRVIQEKKIVPVGASKEVPINVRILCATHQNLERMIQEGKFREDLYFRIATFSIKIPALKERLEDINILAPFFLKNFLSENNLEYQQLSVKALEKLRTYHFPGNIRELNTIIKNAAVFCDNTNISEEHVAFGQEPKEDDFWAKVQSISLEEGKKYFEKYFVKKRLEKNDFNVEKTAKSLGLIKTNLYRKLKQYKIFWK